MTEVSHGISNIHSSDAPGARGAVNRSSIDLSLELEQQLDSEHFSPNLSHFPAHLNGNGGEKRTSLDPLVLAHIVTQLRTSLAQVTQERDDLVQQIAEGYSREAEFKDSLALCTEQYASLEQELETQRKQSQSDKDAITMLRSKVEESRRGLMRLQSERTAESKRMTLDLTNSRASSLSGPRSSHRTSFAPLTGSGQGMPSSFRRTSSTSAATENDPAFAEFVASLPGHSVLDGASANGSSTLPNRRRSMFANRASNGVDGRSSPSNAELEMLKRELVAVKLELEDTRHELSESNEAREASESCVRALREFISQCSSGDSKLQLPPPPSDSHVKDVEPEMKPKGSVWGGLKLWKVDTTAPTASTASSSTIHSAGGKSLDSRRNSSSEHESMSPSTAVPLRNKFGALFARRPSTSAMPHPHQTHNDQLTVNGSDTSSIEELSEPNSPPTEDVTPIKVQEPLAQGTETLPTRDTYQEEPGESHTPKVVSL